MKRFKIYFIVTSLIFPLLILTFSILIYCNWSRPRIEGLYIQAPDKPTGISKNKNQYMHTFFGSEFENYIVYLQSDVDPIESRSDKDKTFFGDIEKMQNYVNDETTVSLWNKDSDNAQLIIKSFMNLDSIEINLDSEDKIEDSGIKVDYGFSELTFAKSDTAFGKNECLWVPDKLTYNKKIENVKSDFMYSIWIHVINNNSDVSKKIDNLNFNLTVKKEGQVVWTQKNTIKINNIDLDYTSEMDKNLGVNFWTDEQRMSNFWLKNEGYPHPDDSIDKNSMLEYEKFMWNNYLDAYWDKAIDYGQQFYPTFISNINDAYINRENNDISYNESQTWEFGENLDPSQITWHAKKKSDNSYELYVTKDNEQAFFYNLNNLIGKGFRKILIRGLSELKYFQNINESSKYPNHIWNDTTNQLETVDLKLYETDGIVNQYGYTAEEMNKLYLDWFVEKLDFYKNDTSFLTKNNLKNTDIDYYLLFDEVRIEEVYKYNEFLKENSKYDFLKIAWCSVAIYTDWTIDTDFIDLIWYCFNEFDTLKKDNTWSSSIKKRQQKGLDTSEYSLYTDQLYNLTGSPPANSAYWELWAHSVGIKGYLRYASTLWTKYSDWSANYFSGEEFDYKRGNKPGDTTFLFPDNKASDSRTYFASSPRLENLTIGDNMTMKMDYLKKHNLVKSNKIYDQLKNSFGLIDSKKVNNYQNRFEFDVSNGFESEYKNVSYDTNVTTDSNFLNWILLNIKAPAITMVGEVQIEFLYVNGGYNVL